MSCARFILVFVMGLASQVAVATDSVFEEAAVRDAAKVLRADLLKGPHHRVETDVLSDGYLNYYKIQSDYGEFAAISTAGLRTRVGEIEALSALDELSKTEVFIDAAAEAGVAQLKTLQAFATRPVETITGIPDGIGRMFGRAKRQTSEAIEATREFVGDDDDEAESDVSDDDESDSGTSVTDTAVDLTEGYLGVGKAQRAWAQKLGTDPYSGNEVLQAAIKEVAWAERLGKFGMGFAGVPSIPGADIIGEVNEAVWSLDPWALEDLNRDRLAATGASEELIEIYFDNYRLTPSQQTLLTASIAEMEGVAGRDGILRQSLRLDGEAEVNFFIRTVTMLAWYHLNKKPLDKVLTYAVVPIGIDRQGDAALLFAVDHLYWTESIAKAAANHAGRMNKDAAASVWLLGTASDRSREELGKLGFSVEEGVASMMLASADE
jgi:hypothetical protein